MGSENDFQPIRTAVRFSECHDNVTQVFVRTTEDKLRNYVRDYQDAHAKSFGWTVPLGLMLSFAGTLLTTSFVDKYGRPGGFWEALFTFAFLACLLWFSVAVVKAYGCRKEASAETLIRRIKNSIED